MEKITTRKATLDDINTLLQFEQGMIHAERPLDPTMKQGHIHYYDLEEMITAPHIHLVVAEEGEEIIGSGYARIEKAKHYLQHAQHAYLGFMYVDPGHRGKEVNKKIIHDLREWSLSQNITEMILEVYYENAVAIRAYEKAGFTKHIIQMRMGLKSI